MAINRELSQFGRLVQIIDNVSIGIGTTSNVSIGFGTISATTFSGSNILVGTATSTGTASQPLQVTGGAYFAGVGISTGSIGVGITRPQGAIDIRTSPQWSGFNYGANLIIGGGRNNGIGILDSTNSNPWAIANNAGNLIFAQMPALGDTASVATEAARITTNRNLLIGSLTETGTASQRLQVTGGGYVSGNLGVGVTNPGAKLDVAGDIRLSSADPEIELNSGGPRLKVPVANTLTIHTGGGLNTTSNEAVRINTIGVGIGTTNPTSKLHVVGDGKFSGVVTATSFIGDGSLLTNLPSGGSSGGGTSSQWTTGATGITTTSNVGIKSTTPTSALDVTGDVKISGIITATDFNSSSDINLKTNIQTIENPISKLFEINGVTFNWIENEKASVGVIAQDVEKVLPQLVNDMGSHKVVNYNGLIGLLVECIKHQQRQIDELKEHMIGS
jgi:hypothetical protein